MEELSVVVMIADEPVAIGRVTVGEDGNVAGSISRPMVDLLKKSKMDFRLVLAPENGTGPIQRF